jgi:hypothetical protein
MTVSLSDLSGCEGFGAAQRKRNARHVLIRARCIGFSYFGVGEEEILAWECKREG